MNSTDPATTEATQTSAELAAEKPMAETTVSVVESSETWLRVEVGEFLPEVLQPAWLFMQDFPILFAAVLVVLGYGFGKLIQAVINKLLGSIAAITQSHLDDHLVKMLEAPIMQTSVLFALAVSVQMLRLPDSIELLSLRIFLTLMVIFWGKAWLSATPVILAELEANHDRFQLFQPRTVPLFDIGIKLLLFGVLAYFVFIIWDIDATAWLASAGIIGIAVGFAAQDTLANLISGVSIIADKPYKIGDYIVLDSTERGIVTHVGIRSTRILTRDDIEVSIPNAVIGSAKITNESGGPWVKQRIRVPVSVAYGSDTEKVVSILEEIAHDSTGIVAQPAARVRMRAFGDSALDFELLGWISSPDLRGLVIHQLLLEIDKRFREEGIEIPFPQRDIHIKRAENTDLVPKPELEKDVSE